jgi:hypothetical protein
MAVGLEGWQALRQTNAASEQTIKTAQALAESIETTRDAQLQFRNPVHIGARDA